MYVVVNIKDNIKTRVSIVNQIELKGYVNAANQGAIRANEAADRAEGIEQDVILEGDIQVARVAAEGDTQVARVSNSGDVQVQRVITEGNNQVGRAGDEADRAEDEADRATAQANEIKAVGVVKPVTSVPVLPSGEPGDPDVDYNGLTGLFTFKIPDGRRGIQGDPGPGFTPQGDALVADLNALVADPTPGDAWWMVDTGTITYGSQNTVISEIDEIVVWVADGYFFNAGKLELGSSWQSVTNVTVDGAPTANGQDLASTLYAVAKTGSTMTGPLVLANNITLSARDSIGTRNLMYMSATDIINIGNINNAVLTLGQWTFSAIPLTDGVQGTAINELTRKDYVDTEITDLGNAVVNSVTAGGLTRVSDMVSCTQAIYDGLTPDPSTYYIIVG